MLLCSACSKKESAQSTLAIINPDQALAELGLATSGDGPISWSNMSGDNGTYVYDDVSIDLEELSTPMMIDKLTLTGATMVENEAGVRQAIFASLTAQDLILSGDDEVTLTIDNFTLSAPTPETAKASAKILSQADIEGLTENAAYGFGELELNDIKMIGLEDGGTTNFTIGNMNITDANEDKIGRFKFSDVAMSFSASAASAAGNGDQDITMSVATFEFNDMPLSQFRNIDGNYAGLASQLGAMNPYEDFMGDVTVADLNFDIMGVTGAMKSLTRRAHVKGDVTELTQKMESFIITPGDQVGPMQALGALGYEQFEFNSESVSYMDESKDLITLGENVFSLKDGFNLSLDIEVGGYGTALKDYAKNVQQLENDDPFERADTITALNKELFNAVNVHELGMNFEDQGLAERGLNFAALMQGTEPERVKSQLSGMMLMYTMTLSDDAKSKMMIKMIEAASDFINNPDTLKLGIYPSSPISGKHLFGLFSDGPEAPQISVDDLGFVAEGG